MYPGGGWCKVASSNLSPQLYAGNQQLGWPGTQEEISMFAQAMLTAVPDHLFTWALGKQTWLRRSLGELALKKALISAFQRFAREYPQWADSLFDEHFILNHAAPLISGSIRQ